jgi:hypothetical protein
MKINLAIPSPRDLSLNFLEVAVESEIEFLTDALAAASHDEDRAEYSRRLNTMKLLNTILANKPEVIEFGDHEEDHSMEDTATAVEKLLIEQQEVLEDEPDLDFNQDVADRVEVGKALLAILRPSD